MTAGDIIVGLLFLVQAFALAAFLVNATITRRRYRRLKLRTQHLERIVEQIPPLTASVAQLQNQMAAVLPTYLSLRQPSPRRSNTARMRAIQQAVQEEQAERSTARVPTQRIPYITRPLQPPPSEE